MTADTLLPFVDAWSVEIEAPPPAVWNAVLAFGPGAPPSIWHRVFARIWRTDPAGSNGLAAHVLGAECPGFAVCQVVPPATYALAGRHRFARYQLVFRIDPLEPGRSRLTAETFAMFPGSAGRLYRMLLMDAKLHGLVMWAVVRRVRGRAEAAARRAGVTAS